MQRGNEANFLGIRVVTGLDIKGEEDAWDEYVVLLSINMLKVETPLVTLDEFIYSKRDYGKASLHESSVSCAMNIKLY